MAETGAPLLMHIGPRLQREITMATARTGSADCGFKSYKCDQVHRPSAAVLPCGCQSGQNTLIPYPRYVLVIFSIGSFTKSMLIHWTPCWDAANELEVAHTRTNKFGLAQLDVRAHEGESASSAWVVLIRMS